MTSAFSSKMDHVFAEICDNYVTCPRGEKQKLPHLHMMLSVNGAVVAQRICGMARADGIILRPDALYRMASMTKPVTLAAALQLVEQGRLGLDQPVSDILPEFAAPAIWLGATAPDDRQESGQQFVARPLAPPRERPMTVLDLMRHTSGLSYSVHQADALDEAYARQGLDSFHQRRTSSDHVAALSALPLRFAPGRRFHYSASIDMLGAVMERVEGLRIEEIVRRRLFAPLAMEDSFFTVPPEKLHRLTDAWMRDGENRLILYDRGARSRWRFTPKSASAGGGLVSSLADYHHFLLMLMQDGEWGGARILSRESVAMMLGNHLPSGADLVAEGAAPMTETAQPGIGMGLGGAVVLDPDKAGLPGAAGCYYWGGLLSTGFFMDKARQMIGLVMTQMMPSTATSLREDFRCSVYKALWSSGRQGDIGDI